MSTYKQIAGTTVKAYTTNPSDPQEGEMWYNQTTLKLRGVTAVGAWSSGGILVTPAYLSAAFGSQTAAVAVGGTAPGPVFRNDTQEYNGTGWSSGTDYPANISNSGRGGTSTAGLVLGGNTPPYTTAANEYDGSTWTSTGALPTAGDNFGSCSTETQTNGIFAQGRTASSGNAGNDKTFTYDGSTFSAGPDINTARMFAQSSGGTGTAGIIYGGFIDPSPNAMTNTEEYDGSSWTAGGALNRASGLNCGFGVQTNAVAQVNTPGYKGTENYDGTAWTNLPDMALDNNSSNYSTAAGATGNAGFITSRGPGFNQTEEWNFSAQVVTAGAWSSGTALPGVRWNTSGAGTQTAGLVFGGSTGPATPTFLSTTFEYDGASWTAGGATPAARINQFSAGIQTAAIGGGGYNTGNHATAYTYDGSTWTTITDTPYATKGAGAGGTSTAALIFGSDISPSDNQDSYSWNGSAWSEEGALNNTFQNGAAGGPTENTTFAAGSEYSPQPSTRFETYNGTAWTSGPSLNTAAYQNRGFGSSTECLSIGGYNKITGVEKFDGTAWATSPTLGTGRKQFASANFTASGVSNGWVGGGADGDSSVEHFTEETTAANTVDITTAE